MSKKISLPKRGARINTFYVKICCDQLQALLKWHFRLQTVVNEWSQETCVARSHSVNESSDAASFVAFCQTQN